MNKIVLKVIILVLTIIFFSYQGTQAGNLTNSASPEKALSAFIEAVQTRDVNEAFELDYYQQGKTEGKFSYEIEGMKKDYEKRFEGNPSICPGTFDQIPCDGPSRRSIIDDVRLFVPKGVNYDVLETIYTGEDRSDARMLVKIVYTPSNGPVCVDDLKAIQIYKGGITPIVPLFSPEWGIMTKDNVFLTAKYTSGRHQFPIKFVRKDVREATLEARMKRREKKWFISDMEYHKGKFSFEEVKANARQSGAAHAEGTYSIDVTFPLLSSYVNKKNISLKYCEKNTHLSSELNVHNGIDISVPAKQPVFSICAGEIVHDSTSADYWNSFLILKHNCSGHILYAYYGHVPPVSEFVSQKLS